MKDYDLRHCERILRRGGNQTGSWVLICTGEYHWRSWDDDDRQDCIGPCDCHLVAKEIR